MRIIQCTCFRFKCHTTDENIFPFVYFLESTQSSDSDTDKNGYAAGARRKTASSRNAHDSVDIGGVQVNVVKGSFFEQNVRTCPHIQ